jgi:hypothetical protein
MPQIFYACGGAAKAAPFQSPIYAFSSGFSGLEAPDSFLLMRSMLQRPPLSVRIRIHFVVSRSSRQIQLSAMGNDGRDSRGFHLTPRRQWIPDFFLMRFNPLTFFGESCFLQVLILLSPAEDLVSGYLSALSPWEAAQTEQGQT